MNQLTSCFQKLLEELRHCIDVDCTMIYSSQVSRPSQGPHDGRRPPEKLVIAEASELKEGRLHTSTAANQPRGHFIIELVYTCTIRFGTLRYHNHVAGVSITLRNEGHKMVISQFMSESEVIVRRSLCVVDESLDRQILFQDLQDRLTFPLGSQSDDLECELDILAPGRFRSVDDVQEVLHD